MYWWAGPRTTPRAALLFRKPHCSVGLDTQNHCNAGLLDGIQPSIGVVCGSDNHMFWTIHIPDRMTRSATSTLVVQGAQSDYSDPSSAKDHKRGETSAQTSSFVPVFCILMFEVLTQRRRLFETPPRQPALMQPSQPSYAGVPFGPLVGICLFSAHCWIAKRSRSGYHKQELA